jgi:succinylglutamate desuccinylase
VARQQATIEKQQRYITQLLERIYGKKSERFDPDQMRFDGMEIEAIDQLAGKEGQVASEEESATMTP